MNSLNRDRKDIKKELEIREALDEKVKEGILEMTVKDGVEYWKETPLGASLRNKITND